MERRPKSDDDPVRNIIGTAKVLAILGLIVIGLDAVVGDDASTASIGGIMLVLAVIAYLTGQYLRGRQQG